jgi:hypothetical protein
MFFKNFPPFKKKRKKVLFFVSSFVEATAANTGLAKWLSDTQANAKSNFAKPDNVTLNK